MQDNNNLLRDIIEYYETMKRSQSAHNAAIGNPNPISKQPNPNDSNPKQQNWNPHDKTHDDGHDDAQPQKKPTPKQSIHQGDPGDEDDRNTDQSHAQLDQSVSPSLIIAWKLAWHQQKMLDKINPHKTSSSITHNRASHFSREALRLEQKNTWDSLSHKEKAKILKKMLLNDRIEILKGMSDLERREITKNMSPEKHAETLKAENPFSAKL